MLTEHLINLNNERWNAEADQLIFDIGRAVERSEALGREMSVNNGHDALIDIQNAAFLADEQAAANELQEFYSG